MVKHKVALIGLTPIAQIFAKNLLKLELEKTYCLELTAMADKESQEFCVRDLKCIADEYSVIESNQIDTIVVCTESVNNAFELIRAALEKGKNVVTNNQTVVAIHGQKLWRLAEDKGVHLRFESTLLGAVPIIESIFNGFGGAKIDRVYGVLNSTCNYSLMRMKDTGCTLASALEDAVELGYAEPDPELDVSGKDSLYKLALLSVSAFGEWPDLSKQKVYSLKGIEPVDIQLAQKFGCNIKMLSMATKRGMTVQPTLFEEFSQLGNTNGTLTGVVVESDMTGPVFMVGHGSDDESIASALLSDTIAIANGRKPYALRQKAGLYTAPNLSRYYVRVPVEGCDKIVKANHVQVIYENTTQNKTGAYAAYIVETGLQRHELEEFVADAELVTSTCVFNVFQN
tara:strand:+ start:206629 stop:207825 length:1197 start_codon:yes stop_codon:yes gene_type:complete